MSQHESLMALTGGLDPLDVPVPGESLTQDPEQMQSFEKPPVHTDMNKAVEDIFFRLTEEESLDEVINLIRADLPLEDIAQVILFSGFREGQFTPDLMLNLLEPTIYILIWIADYAGIDPVLSPDSDIDFFDEESGEELEEVSDVSEIAVPESIAPSLLGTIKSKLDKDKEEDTEEEK